MKNVLLKLKIAMVAAFSTIAVFAVTPSAVAQEVATTYGCGGNQCTTTPPPSGSNENTGLWTMSSTFGGAMTFGSAFGDATGNVTREVGTAGFSNVENGAEFNVGNCGSCEAGAFTGRVFGFSEAGQQSFSLVQSDGGYAEGGTQAQAATELGGEFSAWRGTTTAPATND